MPSRYRDSIMELTRSNDDAPRAPTARAVSCESFSRIPGTIGSGYCAAPGTKKLSDVTTYNWGIVAIAWVGVGLALMMVGLLATQKRWANWAQQHATLLKVALFLILVGAGVLIAVLGMRE